MTYKAYIDNIRVQTGKGPEDFVALAKKKGFIKNGKVVVKHAELLKWLKGDEKLGHGHANSIILYLKYPELARKKIERGE
ncbi:MAG: DUF4287 domain-containing protein [Candidatus Micrarchaeota archaeon]|nr:DUF4287 domain-containing protein [Candidatus Micrarchaeota archaeon]